MYKVYIFIHVTEEATILRVYGKICVRISDSSCELSNKVFVIGKATVEGSEVYCFKV